MKSNIVKSRGEPLQISCLYSAPIQKFQPQSQSLSWDKLFERSVITFWVSLLICGSLGLAGITIFGFVSLGRSVVQQPID